MEGKKNEQPLSNHMTQPIENIGTLRNRGGGEREDLGIWKQRVLKRL